jgi:hypothetical protein
MWAYEIERNKKGSLADGVITPVSDMLNFPIS